MNLTKYQKGVIEMLIEKRMEYVNGWNTLKETNP